MVDYWNFTGDSTVRFEAIGSPLPNRKLGETVTLRLLFWPSAAGTNYQTRFLNVRAYARYAGRADYGRTQEGDAWYQERIPSGASISSNVVQIRPNPTDSGGIYEGIWGLITAVLDTNRLESQLELEMDLFVLGDASDYADRSTVESALATSPV